MRADQVTDSELAALRAGSLEPDRAFEVRSLLKASPELRTRYKAIKALLRPAASQARRWRMPPALFPSGRTPFSLGAATSLALSAPGSFRPLDRIAIAIQGDTAAPDARVLLLRDGAQGWEVASPADPDEVVRVRELQRDADGQPMIELTVQPPSGRQRWAVALIPDAMTLDWEVTSAERWEPVRAAIGSGHVPVVTWEIDVVTEEDASE